MWEELGFTAEGIAKSMQTDGVGTLKEVFTALQDMPDERKVAALSTLFGQWAIEGGAKITNNLGAYEKALAMVSDPSLYTGSMEREFIIQASTSESIDTMVKNSVTALKQDIGTEFLPVKKTLSLAVIDLMNGVRKDMPQLQTLAGTLADLLSAGISKLGDALQAALPYVQKTLDYVADNGPQVAGILGGLAGTFAAMKFAPLAGNLLEGAGSLLFGESGGLGVAAGGSERSSGLLGAVGSLFTGGQKFAGNAVGTISNVAEAAGVGATMANSNMTRTQWGAVTSNGSGSFMQRLENSAIGAYFGIKNRGTLTNQKGTDYKFMQGLMGVAGQITDAKQGGGLLGMAKNAATSSPHRAVFWRNPRGSRECGEYHHRQQDRRFRQGHHWCEQRNPCGHCGAGGLGSDQPCERCQGACTERCWLGGRKSRECDLHRSEQRRGAGSRRRGGQGWRRGKGRGERWL